MHTIALYSACALVQAHPTKSCICLLYMCKYLGACNELFYAVIHPFGVFPSIATSRFDLWTYRVIDYGHISLHLQNRRNLSSQTYLRTSALVNGHQSPAAALFLSLSGIKTKLLDNCGQLHAKACAKLCTHDK